jgi:pimeloyl-ACP methyl ester carboxylesterase
MTERADRRRALRTACLGLATLGLGGCTGWSLRRPQAMELLHADAPGRYAAPTLLVMLPGAYSTPQEFVDEGFVQALRRRRLAVDVVIAGATLDHYVEGRVPERLHEQVLAPARARGVQRVWLLGISLGGLFAMGHAARRPAEIDGVLALAPYLGRRTLLDQIQRAGGPAAWAQGRQPQPDDLIEHEVWAWLARGGGQDRPPLHLGHGRDDRFVDAHRLLAAQLPADRHFDEAGGHDWPVWRALWEHWLDRGLLQASA